MEVCEGERTPAEFPLPLPFPLPLAMPSKVLPDPAVGLVTEPMVLVRPESRSEPSPRALTKAIELPLPAASPLPALLLLPLLLPAALPLPLAFWNVVLAFVGSWDSLL
jgi:hypothetical protein